MRTVDIAGKTYTLRYLLTDRQEIESKCGGKAIMDVINSGQIEHQAIFVWAGLKHGNRKLTPGEVIRLFQRHQDKGGDYFHDVVKWAYVAALIAGLCGRVTEAEATLAFFPESAETGKDEAEGGAIKAAE